MTLEFLVSALFVTKRQSYFTTMYFFYTLFLLTAHLTLGLQIFKKLAKATANMNGAIIKRSSDKICLQNENLFLMFLYESHDTIKATVSINKITTSFGA